MSERPLTIHFFTSYVHEQGTYFRYHNLARGLTQLGQSVTVFGCDISRGGNRSEVRDGVAYEIVNESWKSSIFSQYTHPGTTLRRSLRRYPPCDIAHLFQPFLGAAAGWWRSPGRVKFYDWDDQWTGGLVNGPVRSWRERWPRFAIRHMESRLPRWADRVTAISQYLADRARQFGATDVTVINSGSWPEPMPDRATARAELGLQADALYVGFMGYTVAEMGWCYDGLASNLERIPHLRLTLCGPPPPGLESLPATVRERIDFLGKLSMAQSRTFAAALDLGLLPMEDTTFNQSRLPQKYADHLITGVPLLCSDVGECGRLNPEFATALSAGTTRAQWGQAFDAAVSRLAAGNGPVADRPWLAQRLAWSERSRELLDCYRRAVAA